MTPAPKVRESPLLRTLRCPSIRVAGVITRLSVDVGDRVALGRELATLAATDLIARLRERRAELQRGERTLSRLRRLADSGAVAGADYDDQRDTVDQAKAAVAAASTNSPRPSSQRPSPPLY